VENCSIRQCHQNCIIIHDLDSSPASLEIHSLPGLIRSITGLRFIHDQPTYTRREYRVPRVFVVAAGL
jgi:hypothetical protein